MSNNTRQVGDMMHTKPKADKPDYDQPLEEMSISQLCSRVRILAELTNTLSAQLFTAERACEKLGERVEELESENGHKEKDRDDV